MSITWNTEVNAPCCPGEIVNDDGRTYLAQTDWDYPGVASSFGWDIRSVQAYRCPECLHNGTLEACLCPECLHNEKTDGECDECDAKIRTDICQHDFTDGTVDCRCGLTAGDFMSSAYDYLADCDGATVEDPGYFLED